MRAKSDELRDGATGSPPTQDPCAVYPAVPGIDYGDFQLPSSGLTAEQRATALRKMHDYAARQQAHFLGYQANQALGYQDELAPYLNYHLNNIGDPFQGGNFTLNTKWIERAVLDYYASLWHACWPHDPRDLHSYWGYVLSMGSTEGNLYGLWTARDYLAGKFLLDDPVAEVEARRGSLEGRPQPVRRRRIYHQARWAIDHPDRYTPVAFYSEDTHYSVIKVMRILGIATFHEIGTARYPGENPLAPGQPWPREVPSVEGGAGPGTIDIPALVELVSFFAARGFPILLNLNYGTTFKGAYDDVEAVGNALLPVLRRYGLDERKVHYDPNDPGRYDVREGFWIHVDGALGAAMMPFIEMAHQAGRIAHRGPNFDFRLPFVHSIVMSGHKWIGAPWPCGVYMSKTRLQLRPPDNPEYIGAQDTTFAGSRNGFAALVLWEYLARNSHAAQVEAALWAEALTDYAYQQLNALERKLQQDLWVARSPLSLTIRFKQVNPDLVYKYSLSGETLWVHGQRREYSHIYLMAHVTSDLIDQLTRDLSQAGAFPDQGPAEPVYCHT